MSLKQVILVRSDLKLPKGKLAVQVAHGSVSAVLKSSKKLISNWKKDGMKKIALKVKDLSDLEKYKKEADDSGIVNCMIQDAGHTVVKPGTITVLAIGPDASGKIDKITGHLKTI